MEKLKTNVATVVKRELKTNVAIRISVESSGLR